MTVAAPIPANEAERLAALRRYAILDTEPEESFDRIVRLVSRQFKVPMAVVTLVDENRQWFKAACGLDAKESERDPAFCSHAILGDSVFVVPDATRDERFAANPFVTGDVGLRFYAGAPLVTPDGYRLGTLCLIDQQPRHDFSEDDEALLADLAAVVVDHIEMRCATGEVLTEVEGRLQAEDDLATTEHQLGLFFDHAPVSVAMLDTELRYIGASRRWRETFDLGDQELYGRRHLDLVPHIPEAWRAQYRRSLEGEVLEIEEDRLPRPDGGFNWIQRQVRPWRDRNGAIGGIIVSNEIIDDRKQSEAALRDNEDRYRQLYNKTPIMLHSIDREGRLLSVSDFWLEKLGYERDDVIGRKSSDFLAPDSRRKAINDILPEFMRTGLCTDIEYQMVSRSGEIIDVLLSAIAERDENGDVLKSLAVLTDITDRKEVERQFVQAQKMETVGQLTGGLAHDFNNLLGVVMGNLQLIERSVEDNDKAVRRIKAALHAADKGADLTRRLLAFARRQNLETEAVETGPLLTDMSHMLHRTLGGNIELECHVPDDIPSIRTDPSQLQSAILNLAVNARDAMPDGGKLTIEATTVKIDSDYADRDGEIEPGSYVVIAVTDTGEGIPVDKAAKVFEPFFTTKEVGKGSGLGLSTIYGFMRQSGGQVRIYSEEGRGTTVRLFAPLTTDVGVPQGTGDGEPHAPISGGTETVLIVEDQDDVREVGIALLEDLGYAVVEASNPADGLRLLAADGAIDILFTDIVMPGRMDGTKFAQAARALRPDLPVVFTTGYAEAAVLEEGDVKSAKNLVTKPYRREDLANKVRRALDAAAVETAA